MKSTYANKTFTPILSDLKEKTSSSILQQNKIVTDDLRLHQIYGPDWIRQTFATFPIHVSRNLNPQKKQSVVPRSQSTIQMLKQAVSVICETIYQIRTSEKDNDSLESTSDDSASINLSQIYDRRNRMRNTLSIP